MRNKIVFILVPLIIAAITSCGNVDKKDGSIITMTKAELLDKVKGGWAGQAIGVTYGGPTEFRYLSRMIPDTVEIRWDKELVTFFYDKAPGLYDDIYMDLTFVEIFDKEGLDAPVESFANAFAYADYMLWHANQAARYNILNGIQAPASGNWKNNMHADDIDFQIEADFAGLMTPGMINAAMIYADRIGHIMNYGDGFYGGAYVAAMYSLAFIYDDVNKIVNEALKVIPEESKYYQCMQDVISFHKKYPDDWKKAWQAIDDSEWSTDLHCPDGIASPFNINATINSSYVLLGLLYGGGELEKTLDISTRAGQDSDCNPATAAGILCTMMGYDNIPDYWIDPIKPVEDRDFAYTTISLNDVYDMSYRHALKVIGRFGGKADEESVQIAVQVPEALPLEAGFPNVFPAKVTRPATGDNTEGRRGILFALESDKPETIEFSGIGIVIKGSIAGEPEMEYTGELEVSIDGEAGRIMKLPVDYRKRTDELYWNVQIPDGDHIAELRWLNPVEGLSINVRSYIEFKSEKNKIIVDYK
ncbi:MAG TPA: hypothetical protein DEQ09_06555 [Bacteroidales bacterium]|nr:hypothetical protein [Bacteroidales bacterium]